MDSETRSDGRAASTCVVLADAERPLDGSLRADLEDRGWQVSVRHDPLTAMTDLCLRLRTGHRAEGPAATPALLVVDPDAWPAWPAMRRALRLHLPQVALLERRGDTMTELTGAANGRGAAAARPAAPAPPAGDDRDAVAPASISRDELDMLLQGGAGG